MVFDSMEQQALAYAANCRAELGDSLGFGVDGSVWLLHSKERWDLGSMGDGSIGEV